MVAVSIAALRWRPNEVFARKKGYEFFAVRDAPDGGTTMICVKHARSSSVERLSVGGVAPRLSEATHSNWTSLWRQVF